METFNKLHCLIKLVYLIRLINYTFYGISRIERDYYLLIFFGKLTDMANANSKKVCNFLDISII